MPGKGASGKAKPSAAAAARGTSGPKGIEWRKVDLDSHFMLANPDQFAGLMSFEVVDGSAYDSMYSGTITQDNVDAEAKAIVDEEDAVRAAKRAKQLANQQAPRKAVVEAEADLSAIAAAAETKAAKEPKLSKPSKAAGVPLGAVAAAKAAPAPAPAAAPAALAQAGKVLGKKRKLEEASPAATPGLASVSSAAPAPAPASTVAAAAAAVPKSKLEQLVAQLQSAHLTKQDRAAVIKAIEEEQARTRKAATAAANAAANAANAAAGAGKGKGQGKPALAPQGQSQGQGKANGKKDEKKQAQQGKQQGKKLLVGKKGVQVSDDDDELDVDEKDDEDLEMDGDVDFDSTEVLSALPEALRKAAMSTAASIKGGAGSTKAGAKAKAKGGKDEEKDEGEEGAGADAEDADAESDAETGSDADANAVDGADAVDGAEGADEPSGATGAFSAWAPYSIHPLLMQGIRGLGFKAPTPIQVTACHLLFLSLLVSLSTVSTSVCLFVCACLPCILSLTAPSASTLLCDPPLHSRRPRACCPAGATSATLWAPLRQAPARPSPSACPCCRPFSNGASGPQARLRWLRAGWPQRPVMTTRRRRPRHSRLTPRRWVLVMTPSSASS